MAVDMRILKDALHNAHPSQTLTENNRKYARGVLVGVVAGLMASGMCFDDAWRLLLNNATINQDCSPNEWPRLEDYHEADRQEQEARRRLLSMPAHTSMI